MCYSVSAGWRGGFRHNPDPVAAPDLQQAGEQHPHLPMQAQQSRQYTPVFPLPVFDSGFLFPVVPLTGSALGKDFPYSTSCLPTNSDFSFYIFSSFYASGFLFPDFLFQFPAFGNLLSVMPQRFSFFLTASTVCHFHFLAICILRAYYPH